MTHDSSNTPTRRRLVIAKTQREALNRIRIERGLTWEAMASELEVKTSTLRRLLRVDRPGVNARTHHKVHAFLAAHRPAVSA